MGAVILIVAVVLIVLALVYYLVSVIVALQKIATGMHRIPQKDLRAAGELQAFFIFPAAKGSVSGLFATHPPMEKRIAALMRLEAQLQGTLVA